MGEIGKEKLNSRQVEKDSTDLRRYVLHHRKALFKAVHYDDIDLD